MRNVLLGALAVAAVLTGCGTRATAPTAPAPPAPPSSTGREPTGGSTVPPSPAVAAFLRFATGAASGADVPWGDEVVLSFERTQVARLDSRTARSRSAWRGCAPRTATVEGRSCPLDVLAVVADRDRSGSPVVIENESPAGVVGCVRYVAPRTRPDETTSWLRPSPAARDCFTDMAVAVTVSGEDDGEVVAVDVALSSP